jgi:hypothetical protein
LFFDLTISLSISIFHASLGKNARLARQAGDREGDRYWSALVGEVDEMIWQAVHAGFAYFQRAAGYTRTGSHNTRVHGRETGQWREADLAVAHWLQHTAEPVVILDDQRGEIGQLITDLATAHRTFAGRPADRQSPTVPSRDPGYGDLGQAFPPWPAPSRDAILQPPKPEIRPSPQILERAAVRDGSVNLTV